MLLASLGAVDKSLTRKSSSKCEPLSAWLLWGVLLLLGKVASGASEETNSTLHYKLQGSIRSVKPSCLLPWEYGEIALSVRDFDVPEGVNVSCHFVSASLHPEIVEGGRRGLVEFSLEDVQIEDILKAPTAVPARRKRPRSDTWYCTAPPMLPGSWVPLLVQHRHSQPVEDHGKQPSDDDDDDGGDDDDDDDAEQSVEFYASIGAGGMYFVVAETRWSHRLVRSGIERGNPGLLIAGRRSLITFWGNELMDEVKCYVSTKRGSFQGKLFNSTVADCKIMGPVGDASVKVVWGPMCSQELPVQFFNPPEVAAVQPAQIPRWGNTTVVLDLKLSPKWRKGSDAFVPENSFVVALLRIESILPGWRTLEVPGSVDFISETQWQAKFDVAAQEPFQKGSYPFEMTLNGRDFVAAKQALVVDGPYVSLASPLDGVEEGSSSKIRVQLSAPVMVPVYASLHIMSDDVAPPKEDFELVVGKIRWEPGEFGEKVFLVRAGKNATKGRHGDNAKVRVALGGVVNADVHRGLNTMDILFLKSGEMPTFDINSRQVLYPGDGDTYFEVVLQQGSAELMSVLKYSVYLMEASELGCNTKGLPIQEVKGNIPWEGGQSIERVDIPIDWRNVPYSSRLHIAVDLEPWQISRVEKTTAVVAHVFGVPDDVCPPGTLRDGNSKAQESDSGNPKEDFPEAMEVLSVKGYPEVESFSDVQLVPFFSPDHNNYTALVPYGIESVVVVVRNETLMHSMIIKGEKCTNSSNLVRTGSDKFSAEARISMHNKIGKLPCTLQVRWNKSWLETLLPRETHAGGTKVPFPDITSLPEEYQIQFVQLGPPSHAKLSAVELRNLTHVVMICGPLNHGTSSSDGLKQLEEESSFEVIPGYPRQECDEEEVNILQEPMMGSPLVIIPRLVYPNDSATKVEVSGVLLQGFDQNEEDSGPELSLTEHRNNSFVPATVIQNIPSESSNVSISFDILVTGEDTVTTNRYQFILGSPSSDVKVFAAGSAYDRDPSENHEVEPKLPDDNSSWPASPAQSAWCKICPEGMYSSVVDSPECSPCRPGHYADWPGSCGCKLCSPGTYTYMWSSEACRPCMIGTYSKGSGSEQCDICSKDWTTHGEGQSSCLVHVRKTDLSKHYAIIASFGVFLNGTSLEEISSLEPGVSGPGVAVLSILIKKDVSEAFNISIGDVDVTDVSQVGQRTLLVNVTTTFKVPMPMNATEEEQNAVMQNALLEGDSAIWEIVKDADRALQRTTKATNAHAKVTREDVRYHQWKPAGHPGGLSAAYVRILLPIMACLLLVVGSAGSFWCRLRKKEKHTFLRKIPFYNALSWDVLRIPSESTVADQEETAIIAVTARHRHPIAVDEEP
ncbi:hypothetical protein BSKO_00647 [Bryopsis sp. KO-2023]|nr:hypothetical protein BSKO_00647 [Bryopsis sp. KO-2023]